MSDEEDYEFEYSDQDEGGVDEVVNEVFVTLQNQFYGAKSSRDAGELQEAVNSFQSVVDLVNKNQEGATQDYLDFRFKSMKNIVKLQHRLGQSAAFLESFKKLLGLLGDVTRNRAEKALNTIIDLVASSAGQADASDEFYSVALSALEQTGGNEVSA